MSIYTKQFINPIIINPVDHICYMDDPTQKLDDNYQYGPLIVNGKGYSLAASAKPDDPLKITEVFYNNGTPETNFADQANDLYTKLNKAKETRDRSLAAAIITSKEYTLLQDSVVISSSEESVRTGILSQLFETIAVPNLTGKFNAFSDDVKYHTNLSESKSPEPSLGTASQTTVEVPKHGGAVAITDRARQVINGADVFGRLVSKIQQARLISENTLIKEEIESIPATNDQTGVDFGDRSGSPPASDQNPIDLWNTIITFFEGTSGTWDTILSNALVYNEYVTNDFVRGVNNPIPTVTSVNESSGPVPALGGVTWFRDDSMTTLTEAYVMDRSKAGKNFVGPTRAYTVTDPDTETEKYVTKSHFLPLIVDQTVIARVTGVQA